MINSSAKIHISSERKKNLKCVESAPYSVINLNSFNVWFLKHLLFRVFQGFLAFACIPFSRKTQRMPHTLLWRWLFDIPSVVEQPEDGIAPGVIRAWMEEEPDTLCD